MTDGIARLLGQRYWLTEKGWAATEPKNNDTGEVRPHAADASQPRPRDDREDSR